MAKANANTHLTLEERKIIEIGIRNGSPKTAISDTLGKDNSTIWKEIKLHRELSHKCHMPLECKGYRKCVHGRQCTQECLFGQLFPVPDRPRTPRKKDLAAYREGEPGAATNEMGEKRSA